jgi:hypothetical protein
MASEFKYDITNMCHPLIAHDLNIFVGGDLWTAEDYDAVLLYEFHSKDFKLMCYNRRV